MKGEYKMTNVIIAQDATIHTLLWCCILESIALAGVGAYFTWKLYGWLEEKIADYRSKEPEFEHITLRGNK